MSCRRFAPALLACVLAVAVAASAQAAPKTVVGVVGEGDFGANSPRGLAVNATTGDVYVADAAGHRIRRYSAAGAFLSELGTGGTGNTGGRFNAPTGVAVDQGDEGLWVVDSANNRVQRFGALDAFGLHPFERALGWDVTVGGGTGFEVCQPADTCKNGVSGAGAGQFAGTASFTGHAAVDPVSGKVYVTDPVNRRVQRFDPGTGAHEATLGSAALFGGASPTGIAFDASGALYLVDGGNGRVLRCNVLGTPEQLSCSAFAGSALSGTSAYAVAVDTSSDHILVARRPEVEGLPPAEHPIEIVELEPDGDIVEIHGGFLTPNNQVVLGRFGGLAVNPSTGAIYVSVPGTAANPRRVLILGDAPTGPATATLAATTAITDAGATVNGSVVPGGAPTGHRFEYRTGAGVWTSVPATAGNHGSGADPVPVTETVTGLEPNTRYEVRLVADRLYGPGDTTTAAEAFTTAGRAPALSGFHSAADDTSAAVEASIDDNNAITTYRFEHGLDATYGTQTPVRQTSAPKRAVERITGLAPGTTYHYRVVATNATGTTEGPDQTFTTDGQAPAPARPYELVSPAGGEAELRQNGGGMIPSTPDGNHVCITSAFPMDGAPASGGTLVDDVYCAHRGASGWAMEWVSRPRGEPRVPISATGAVFRWITDDGTRKVFATHFRGLVPDGPPLPGDEGFDTYLRADGTTRWVSPATPLPDNEWRQAVAGSADLTHLVYVSSDTTYEWTPGGVRTVSVDQAGTPATGSPNLAGSSNFGTSLWAVPGTISRDGRRIFFESSDALAPGDTSAGSDVYLREDGDETRLVSSRTGPASIADVTFAGASDDGATAYLHTTAQLTGDAISGGAVYRYDRATEALTLIADDVTNVLAVSRDGSTVVFYGTNVLAPADGRSLYVARGGTTTRVAPLAAGDVGGAAAHRVGANVHVQRALRLSPDGRVLAFRAESDTPGVIGVYRWSTADGLQVVSHDRNDDKVAAEFGNGHPVIAPGRQLNAGRGMSDDGASVFFETAATLNPRDTNGDVDVYEWRGGTVRLITPGAVAGEARYLDNSADGTTVFFTTFERVLPRADINATRDLYAARAGGGFPEPPPSTVGDPPAEPPPVTAPPAPASDSGAARDGEQAVDPRPVLTVRRPSAAGLRRLAAGKTLALPVAVTGGGKVTVRATATLRGKTRRVAGGSGRKLVRLRLSSTARDQLRRKGRLRVRLVVTAPGAEPWSAQVTVKRGKQG